MGIPTYFKYITDNHPEIINNFLENEKTKNKRLYLDLNCAIHKCCRNILNNDNYINLEKEILEEKMLKEIITYILYKKLQKPARKLLVVSLVFYYCNIIIQINI